MIKAVVDVNVLVSGMLNAAAAPGRVLAKWDDGSFELVVSPALIDELTHVMQYPKLKDRIPPEQLAAVLALIESDGHHVADPETLPPIRSEDPKDDYLIALVLKEDAALVSGDRHLTDLRAKIPVFSPAEFLDYLAAA